MAFDAGQPHPLEVVLHDRGLTFGGLAALYREQLAQQGLRSGADRQLMWKWKAGRRTPTSESQQVLAAVLGVSQAVVDTHVWPTWLWYATAAHDQIVEPPWSPTGTMQVLHQVTGGRVDRREFLIITGTSLVSVATQWAASVGASAASAPFTSVCSAEQLTEGVLTRLDSRLDELRRLDDVFGGGELRHLATAELRWLTNLASNASYNDAVGHRLFGLITEAARLCGWLHFDVAHHAEAQAHYVSALRCSATANDVMAGAHVLACMSFQTMLNGHPQDAISLLDTAEDKVGTTGGARLKALLASRKARALAIAGDAVGCGRELNRAERHLDLAEGEHDAPDWIYYFDEAELAAQAGACWVSLAQPDKARPLIDNALRSMDASYVRDRTIYHVRSAQAYADSGELDLACQDLTTAVDLAGTTGSVRSVNTIRAGRTRLDRYSDDRRVLELDEKIAGFAA